MSPFEPPVSQLLRLADPRNSRRWLDYGRIGLGPEHIPDLIRMATDPTLNEADAESAEVWAPLHAWRALGQLRAEAAVGPLLDVLNQSGERDDDWGLEELPVVFAMIGPAAIPALADFLADDSKHEYARTAAARALASIGKDHPAARQSCLAILDRSLESMDRNPTWFNGFLVGSLLDMEAVESAPLIERAFLAGLVDETIVGSWENVRYDLGLGGRPPTPIWADDEPVPRGPSSLGEARQSGQRKAKRKQEKKSRKQNRRRR